MEVQDERAETYQAEKHRHEADPDETILVSGEIHLALADISLHIQSDRDRASVNEGVLLQEAPIVAIVTDLDIGRVVHFKAPAESEVPDAP